MRQTAKSLIISLLMSAGPLAAQGAAQDLGRVADSGHARVAEVLPGEGAPPVLSTSALGLEVGKPISVSASRLAARVPVAHLHQGVRASTAARVATGAAIGFGLGALLGGTVGQEACLNSPRWHCAVNGGAVLAGVGALVAWRIR